MSGKDIVNKCLMLLKADERLQTRGRGVRRKLTVTRRRALGQGIHTTFASLPVAMSQVTRASMTSLNHESVTSIQTDERRFSWKLQ